MMTSQHRVDLTVWGMTHADIVEAAERELAKFGGVVVGVQFDTGIISIETSSAAGPSGVSAGARSRVTAWLER